MLPLWPSEHAKAYNVALAMEYSPSVALDMKRLDTPTLDGYCHITYTVSVFTVC